MFAGQIFTAQTTISWLLYYWYIIRVKRDLQIELGEHRGHQLAITTHGQNKGPVVHETRLELLNVVKEKRH